MAKEQKFCIVCQQWVAIQDSTHRYKEHHHVGSEASYLFPCEWPIPIGDHALGGPTLRKTWNAAWRVGWIIRHEGYSDHDVYGHTAGGWSHYHYRAMRSHKLIISFPSRQAALDFIIREDLEDIVGIEPSVDCGASGYW